MPAKALNALSVRQVRLPLPLAGEGWAGGISKGFLPRNALSVPSPLVGEGQGGG